VFSDHLQLKYKRQRRFMYIGFVIALICAFAALGSGLGYRVGLWHFRTGIEILKWTFFVSAVTLLLLLVCVFFLKAKTTLDLIMGILGIVISATLVYVPYSWKKTLDRYPYIHDVTTDMDNPPEFVAAARLRGQDDHPVKYDGPDVAEQQKKAYPNIQPVFLEDDPASVLTKIEAALLEMGLEITESNADDGRVEAVDTTFLFGFRDDVVVRVTAEEGKRTRVDVRSKSRVGMSDLGENAKRITRFIDLIGN